MDGKFSTFQAIPTFTNLHYRKLPSKGLNILLKTYINIVEDSGNLQRERKGQLHSEKLPFYLLFSLHIYHAIGYTKAIYSTEE